MSFLFVGGSQRSGTSVLYRLLCADAKTNALLPEASYFRTLVQAYAVAEQDFEHDTCGFFRNREALRHFHAGLVHLFLQRTLAQHEHAETLVLKEPHLTQLFPEVHALVPEARFIVSARDPRDIIASMIAVGERMRGRGETHFFQQRDMQQLSNHVKSFYAPVLNARDADFRRCVLVIRYEQVVARDGETMEALRHFTGLALPVRLASEDRPRSADERPRYRPWYTEHSGAALTDAAVGRHRDALTHEEIAAVENHCGDLMRALGYG